MGREFLECEHGQLARQCQHCLTESDLKDENTRLQKQVEQLTKENALLERDNADLQRKIDAQLGSTY